MKPPVSGKKYLLYARVSPKGSTWSAEETSIAVQFEDMWSFILRHDSKAEFVEVFDEFKSGKNLNRGGVQRILSDLDRRPCPWHCLVVWNLDRLSRSIVDAVPIFSKLHDANCEFISIRQEYLSMTGAMARFNLHQTISLAQLEREMTSERVSAKMRWIAEQGKVPFGCLPLGYMRAPGLKNTVVIDSEKAEIVRSIFTLYAEKKLSFTEISERFPGVFRNRQNFYKILRNPLYVGELHYAGGVYRAECPPIIDRDLFDSVQAMLPGGRYNVSRPCAQKYDYLLSGLIRCHCGRVMTAYSVNKSGRKYFYYKCTDPGCKNAVNASSLDSAVIEKLKGFVEDHDFLRRCVAEYEKENSVRQDDLSKKIESAEKTAAAAAEKENQIAEMFLSGIVNQENASFWNAKLSAARADKKEADRVLADFRSCMQTVPENDLFPVLLKECSSWADILSDDPDNFALKRNLVLSLIDEIECLERKGNKIRYRLRVVMTKCKKWCAHKDSNLGPND